MIPRTVSLKGADLTELQVEELAADVDRAFCASSFEPRCTAIPGSMEELYRARGTVLAFEELSDDRVRKENDAWFEDRTAKRFEVSITRSDSFLRHAHEMLRDISAEGKRPSLLIDYSSLPKPFYVGLLAVARHHGDCDLLLGYDVGKRSQQEWGTGEVDSIYAIPGFEGTPGATGCEMAIISLGFDGHQASGVEEVLQPTRYFSLLASPGVSASDTERALLANKSILEHGSALRSSVRSVWSTVAELRDLVRMRLPEESVTVVPLGPKPHALALAILACEYPEITYLHVLTRYPPRRRIEAANERVWTQIRFRRMAHLQRED